MAPEPGAVGVEADRPPLEDEQERLLRLRDLLRDRLSEDLRLPAWAEQGDRLRSACTELGDDAGTRAFLPSLLLAGGIPDADWPRAVALLEQLAGEEGFGATEVVVDRPGQHEVVLTGRWGSQLRLGSVANASLALRTGCHLPRQAGG